MKELGRVTFSPDTTSGGGSPRVSLGRRVSLGGRCVCLLACVCVFVCVCVRVMSVCFYVCSRVCLCCYVYCGRVIRVSGREKRLLLNQPGEASQGGYIRVMKREILPKKLSSKR